MDLDADLLLMFDEFASPATLSGRSVRGIYDDRPDDGMALGGLPVYANRPGYLLPAADVLETDEGASVTLPEGDYIVSRIDPAGPGLVRLTLEEPQA